MSNELVRASQTYLAKSDHGSLRKDAGKNLVAVGGGGLGLWFLAGVLPFITLPMLLIAAVVYGGYLYVK